MEDKSLKFQVGKDERGKGIVKEIEKAVLVSVHLPTNNEEQITEYLDELEFLAHTAGAETVRRFVQRLPHLDTRHFVGKGKMEEIAKYIESREDISIVIFDDDLSPKQQGILEENFKVKVLDRSSLILDIFAGRAYRYHHAGVPNATTDPSVEATNIAIGRALLECGLGQFERALRKYPISNLTYPTLLP